MKRKALVWIVSLGFVGLVSLLNANGIKTNEHAPDFSLKDTHGQPHSLSAYKGKFVVLEWTNYGCPFVRKHYNSGNMQGLQKEMTAQNVIWLSICSSAKGKEGNMEPAEWNQKIQEKGAASTAVLLDSDGQVGKLYGAKTTPHMFIIDPQGLLIYQGAIDNRPSTDIADIQGSLNYVRQALHEAMAGQKVSVPTTESYGCSVKYKS